MPPLRSAVVRASDGTVGKGCGQLFLSIARRARRLDLSFSCIGLDGIERVLHKAKDHLEQVRIDLSLSGVYYYPRTVALTGYPFLVPSTATSTVWARTSSRAKSATCWQAALPRRGASRRRKRPVVRQKNSDASSISPAAIIC